MKKIILGILVLLVVILATIVTTHYVISQKNPSVVKDENFINTMTTDLNSDGIMDQISFQTPKTLHSFTLQVNDALLEENGQNLKTYIEIVDIDPYDSLKEIAVSDYGPSSDYRTFFYFYDGKNLISMGETSGVPGIDMTFPGDGTFTTQTRGQILQTWFYEDQFKLTSDHLIENIPQDLYEMNTPVTVLQSIPLQKSRTDSEQIAVLEVGESATILSSDNKEWCLVETSTGVQGWFAVENFNIIKGTNLSATDVFEGLSMAD